ncbi:MAG: transposase [Pirellulales bacterium]|nr:transposase [Pirellulales bacterium]
MRREATSEHRSLILNWFHARGFVSSGTVEGLNNKCKLTMKKSYGFRMYETIKTALFHTLLVRRQFQF